MRIDWASQTSVGRTRQRNEDAHAGKIVQDKNNGNADRGLFVLCDGMGGHAGGEQASQMAVQIVHDRLAPLLETADGERGSIADEINNAVLAANQAIFERNQRAGASGRDRAGTTIVVLFVANDRLWLIHAGDSRAYQITTESTRLLTRDHNVGNRELRRGVAEAEAWQRSDADQLTQALGPASNEHVHPELLATTVDEDSLLLLCSDGVSDNDFVERAGAALLRPLVRTNIDLTKSCADFINAADNANGHDNLTAILVRLSGSTNATPNVETATTDNIVRTGLWARLGTLFSRRSV